jgi:hypothetical protein
MHPRLKKIIFNKLYEDLKHVEIIPYKESVWFIDREKKYWYLEYEKNVTLWWRYDFFTNFFRLFSLEQSEYERVIADWVEEVLNFKVGTTNKYFNQQTIEVEEVLNSRVRVKTTFSNSVMYPITEEEVLNFKVDTTKKKGNLLLNWVEKVLNSFRVN